MSTPLFNLNATTPAAPANAQNVNWQFDNSNPVVNVSANVALGGTNTGVQVNSNGVLYADSNFTWDHSARVLTISGVSSSEISIDSSGNLTLHGLFSTLQGGAGGSFQALDPTTATADGYTIAIRPGTSNKAAIGSTAGNLWIFNDSTGYTTWGGVGGGTATIGYAGATTPNILLLPTTTGTAGQILTTNGGNPQQLSWSTGVPGVIGGSIAVNQVAFGASTNNIAGSSTLTYTTGLLTLGTLSGAAEFIMVPSTGTGFETTFSANNDGTFTITPAASGSVALDLTQNGLEISAIHTAATNLVFNGASTGSAQLGVAAIAGTPNRINLPTSTGTAGQVLATDGNNPQQASWVTAATIGATISAGQVAFGTGTNAIGGSADLTYSAPTLTIANTLGVNTTPTTITKDTGDNFFITTGIGVIEMNPNGTIQLNAGGVNHPSLFLGSNGSVSLSGINTGTIGFLEGAGGYLNGTNQIEFSMFDTGTPPHGVWFNGTGQIFLETSSTNYNGGSIFMQNVTGQNNVLTQVSLVGSPPTNATYTGTFSQGGSNQLAGLVATFSGFVNAGNNVTATIIASTGTTLEVAFTTQVAEVHAGTVLINISSPALFLVGSMWNGSAFVADTYAFQGVSPAAPGTNSIVQLTHTGPGGSGFGGLEVGLLISSGAITTNTAFGSAAINGSVGLVLQGNTPATSGANVSSGVIQITGEYWTGSASANDIWTIENVLGTGPNPTSHLVVAHSGSTGANGLYLTNPNLATSPSNQFNAPSLAFQGSYWDNVGSPPVGSAQPDIFSFDLTNIGNALPAQAQSTITLNHTGAGVAFFTLGTNIFRFTSPGENVFGTIGASSLGILAEESNSTLFTLSAASNAAAGLTTYTGTFAIIFPTQGQYVTIAGFTNAGNNGRFLVSGTATGTNLVVYNPNGISESHAATATIDNATSYDGTVSSLGFGIANGFSLFGTPAAVTMGSQAEPGKVPFVFDMAGNATDSGYLRIINNPVTGNHGAEFGAVIDGTGANPVILQIGEFNGVPEVNLSHQLTQISSLAANIITVTANYMTLPTDHTVLTNSTGAVTITLNVIGSGSPAMGGVPVGQIYIVKNISTGTTTVQSQAIGSPATSANIDGAPTFVISSQYAAAMFQWDGTNWWVL